MVRAVPERAGPRRSRWRATTTGHHPCRARSADLAPRRSVPGIGRAAAALSGQSVRVQDSVAIDPRGLSGGTSRGDRSPILVGLAAQRSAARAFTGADLGYLDPAHTTVAHVTANLCSS